MEEKTLGVQLKLINQRVKNADEESILKFNSDVDRPPFEVRKLSAAPEKVIVPAPVDPAYVPRVKFTAEASSFARYIDQHQSPVRLARMLQPQHSDHFHVNKTASPVVSMTKLNITVKNAGLQTGSK